ncbi:uncharacterized protein LOC127872266 [Dreissena polymorpha]|uniref:uncharacterized protein LOC127872266 n=1 Tax=Dreissena polymorpha TaxID=45954 RepID=UPI0022641E25|nr:uncharacterized protein LOC127872266 [Dreissena polymorpha]
MVSLVHGASVTVSRNITVKPTPEPLMDPRTRVNITLECIGSSSDLNYYIKNKIFWSEVTDTGQTVKLMDGFYSARETCTVDYNVGVRMLDYCYDDAAHNLPAVVVCSVGVKYSDDGEYTCTLIAENKTVADKKTVKVTVVHPVDSVMLTLYDSMNHKYKDSNASVTDPTEAVQIKPGSYRVECRAIGSNPAPKVEIKFNGTSIAMSDSGDKSLVNGRPSYSSTVNETTEVAAKAMDQLFTCDANIAGMLPLK